MKIAILLHPYGERESGGLARAIFELTRALISGDSQNEYFLLLKERPRSPPSFPGRNWSVHILGSGPLWLDRGLRKAPQADVYIFNTPIMPLWRRPPKSIVIAYDFAYRHFHAHTLYGSVMAIALARFHAFSLRRSDAIIAVSLAVKRDIVKFFSVPEAKITVVHLGLNKICEIPPAKCEAAEPFFLFVGALKERKNILGIIQSFHKFSVRHPEYHFVFVGKGGGEYHQKILRSVEEKNLTHRIHFQGYVSDAELSYLYRRATALVFPSFVEGFSGFPVFEAMGCGLPVITSAKTPFNELGESGALLVDPSDHDDIARAMDNIIGDTRLRAALIDRGHAFVKNFTWAKTAEETLAVCDKVMGHGQNSKAGNV